MTSGTSGGVCSVGVWIGGSLRYSEVYHVGSLTASDFARLVVILLTKVPKNSMILEQFRFELISPSVPIDFI